MATWWRPTWWRPTRWRPRWWPEAVRMDDAPIAVILPEPLAGEVRSLLAAGERIEAVRRVRARTHLGLLPAVLAVDALRDGDGG